MAEALALPSRARARAKRRHRRFDLPQVAIEEMYEDAVVHALKVIGLARHGAPLPGEPLRDAVARVAEIVGHDADLALRVAGLAAVNEAGGPNALVALLNDLPPWLNSFTFVNADRYMLGLELRGHENTPLSFASMRVAVRAWPRLPTGACKLED